MIGAAARAGDDGARPHVPHDLSQLLNEVAICVQLRANRGGGSGRFPEHLGIGNHDVLSSATKS